MATDLLKAIPLFGDLNDTEREELRRFLQRRRFEPNQAIVWIGEPGDDFFIVEAGQVVICYPDEHGREVTLAVLEPGQFFGELSLLDGGRRTATARAHGEVHLLALGREAFHEFVKHHPSSAIHILTTLGRRQREQLDKLRGIKNANEVMEENRTAMQKLAERVARVFASEGFLIGNVAFFVVWIVANTALYHGKINFHDDPPTFFWLGFIITLEAIVLSMFVLNSQKQQARRDAIKTDLDYQVNRKAHLEIMQLHAKLDRLEAMIGKQGPGTDGRTAAPALDPIGRVPDAAIGTVAELPTATSEMAGSAEPAQL